MDNVPTTIYIAFGAVVAAIITAVISIVSSVIAKESKISELRQYWINDLRTELSQLISLVNKLSVTWRLTTPKTGETWSKWIFEHVKEVQEIDELTHRLRMRLNPKEDDELIRLILKLESLVNDKIKLKDGNNCKNTYDLFTKESQQVLKREWTKVKSGENSYKVIIQYSKNVVFICFIVILSLFVIA